jgi:hypothetical protein
MTQLSSLITDDPRTPLQKLRRSQLQKLARDNGISFDPKGPATSLRLQLEGAGIDGSRSGLFQTIRVQDENGLTKEIVDPIIKPHSTQDKDINYSAIIEANAKASEKEEENTELKKELETLKAMVQKLTEVNEEKPLAEQYEETFGKKPHHLMKEQTMRERINGQNTT